MKVESINLVAGDLNLLTLPNTVADSARDGSLVIKEGAIKRGKDGKFLSIVPDFVLDFTVPGTYSIEVPQGVDELKYTLAGPGGGGGGSGLGVFAGHYTKNGGAGGDGAREEGTIAVVPLETLTLVIGEGGAPGINKDKYGTNGDTGQSTILYRGTTELVTVLGGGGGYGGASSDTGNSSIGSPGNNAQPVGGALGGTAGSRYSQPTAGNSGFGSLSAFAT